MPACSICGGFGSRMVKNPHGPGIINQPCACQNTETPGRVAHPHSIVYPQEVITALRAASQAQRGALALNQPPYPG